jgi:hypothetical protein
MYEIIMGLSKNSLYYAWKSLEGGSSAISSRIGSFANQIDLAALVSNPDFPIFVAVNHLHHFVKYVPHVLVVLAHLMNPVDFREKLL